MELNLDDIVKLKKPHPCGGTTWKIVRTGADFKLTCTTCGHMILIEREKLIKMIRPNGIKSVRKP